ncbi:hypothetical protein ACFC1R_38130 [Kitasatospora sp. NPDC056138]|uniref:hypothetical protein n=1 Tax=Kitasatospora sp. NPDC056138 TaxID=3345724 RepID=UPI0035D6131E
MGRHAAGAESAEGTEGTEGDRDAERVPAQDPGPSWTLTAVGALFAVGVLVLAGWLLRFPADEFRYTAGMAGTPGTFTAAHCHTVGSGKSSHRECQGRFVPHDGSPADPTAHISNARVDVGKPAELRRTDGGGYVQPGASNAAMDLAAIFGILCGAAFLLLFPVVGPRKVQVEKGIGPRANPQPWGTLIPLVFGLFLTFLIAAGLTFTGSIVLVVAEAIFS